MSDLSKKDSALIELILTESMRQDSLMHDWSASLGTKTALYMVFVAFIFSAETTVAELAKGPFASALVGLAMFFSLLGIVPLLFASFLYRYRKPPRPEIFREQCLEYSAELSKKGIAPEERILRIKEKLTNSFCRCVDQNFNLNERIANNLKLSSILLGLAIGMLLLLALTISVPKVFLGPS